MSVWTSAVIEHPWTEFSEEAIGQISLAASNCSESPRWFGCSEVKSPEEDFNAHGYAPFFLPRDFSLYFYSNVLEIHQAIRWFSFLTIPQKRHDFLQSCKSIAQLTLAKELILMPEGVADLFIGDGTNFQEFKSAAREKLGPPDLDIRKPYTEEEVGELPQTRVHYFCVSVAEI